MTGASTICDAFAATVAADADDPALAEAPGAIRSVVRAGYDHPW